MLNGIGENIPTTTESAGQWMLDYETIATFAESVRKEAFEDFLSDLKERAKIQPINFSPGAKTYWIPPGEDSCMIDIETEQGQAFVIEYYKRKHGWKDAK